VRKIADLFVSAARGDLDSLEMAPEEPVFTKAGLVRRLWSFLRVLPSAGVPAILVWVFRNTLQEPVCTYSIIGSAVWACLMLMSEFDPRFGDPLDIIGKVAGLLPGREKSKPGG
jgi:hypothetical protein